MQDVDGRDGELPVGDAKVTQVGPSVAGEAGPSVKAGPAEVTAHQAEGARVEVSHCGERERTWTAWAGGMGAGVTLHRPLSPCPWLLPQWITRPVRVLTLDACLALCYTCSCCICSLQEAFSSWPLLSPFTQLKASGTSPPEILLQDGFAVIWMSLFPLELMSVSPQCYQ